MVKPMGDVDHVFSIVGPVIMRVIPDAMTIRAPAQGQPIDLQAYLEILCSHSRHRSWGILTRDGFKLGIDPDLSHARHLWSLQLVFVIKDPIGLREEELVLGDKLQEGLLLGAQGMVLVADDDGPGSIGMDLISKDVNTWNSEVDGH